MANKNQTYNDGVLEIYKVDNIAGDGDFPKEGLVLKQNRIRYCDLKVYDIKYWTALQGNTKIEKLLRIPKISDLKTADVIIPIDGKQYRIVQIQYPVDVIPKSIDISLENIGVDYEKVGDTNEAG